MQKEVIVDTVNGQTFTGILSSFNSETMSVCLSNARDGKGRQSYKLFINGSVIAHLHAVERPYNLRGLAERLERVFPKLVRVYEEQGVIVVMDRIRVTEKGVVEGTGPAAERVRRIYEDFTRETKA